MDTPQVNVGRGLSKEFMAAFGNGILVPLLERVRKDHTLDFQIRREEVHIYYRGGKILGLKRNGKEFHCSFDTNYGENGGAEFLSELPKIVSDESGILKWIDVIPSLKEQMDFYFTRKSESNEREFQQLIVRTNNYAATSNGSDYFIVDIEYVHPSFEAGRVDLIAFKWKSEGSARKKGQVTLAFIEVKCGDRALTGDSGVVKHVKCMTDMAQNKKALNVVMDEMLTIFRQKRELGLVKFGKSGNENDVSSFSNSLPEIMLILVDHDPASKVLNTELKSIGELYKETLTIAVSNFMGYGLFEESVYHYDEFMERFSVPLQSKP